MGTQPGQGRGGLAKDEATAVGFKTERGKVATQKGAIIGQKMVKGEQIKGDVNTSFVEVLSAAQHEASDRINRNRVPRQYQTAIKAYFSAAPRSATEAKRTSPTPPQDGASPEKNEAPDSPGIPEPRHNP